MNEKEIRDKFGFKFLERCQVHINRILSDIGAKPKWKGHRGHGLIVQFNVELLTKELVEDLLKILIEEGV